VLTYVAYFDQLPTVAMLTGLVGPAQTGAQMLRPVQALFFADVAGLLVLAVLAGPAPKIDRGQRFARTITALVSFGVVASVAWFSLGSGPADGMAVAQARGLTTWSLSSPLARAEAASPRGRAVPAEADQARIDRLLGIESQRIDEAPAPGAASGANVIIVQVEALQTLPMRAYLGDQEITPELNKLAKESWFFPNTVSQAGRGATADVEFVVSTGMYPPEGKPVPVTLADREIPSLPRTLRAAGYETLTMHVNDVHFWNRHQLYPALGFKSYVDRSYFGTDDTIGWGQSDGMFYRLAMDPIAKMDAYGAPYYVQLVTITSHHPFAPIPSDRQPLELSDETSGTTVGRYLQSINYADRELGDFVDALESSGILDNTILVVYGDHTALNPSPTDPAEAVALEALAGPNYTRLSSVKVPLLIRLPGQTEGRTVETVVGQSDIAPTLAELLGTSLGSRPVFGASVFRAREGGVVPSVCRSAWGSFVTYAGMYRPDADKNDFEFIANDGSTSSAAPGEAGLAARVSELLELNDAYAATLPMRPNAEPVARDAILPPAGRAALQERLEQSQAR